MRIGPTQNALKQCNGFSNSDMEVFQTLANEVNQMGAHISPSQIKELFVLRMCKMCSKWFVFLVKKLKVENIPHFCLMGEGLFLQRNELGKGFLNVGFDDDGIFE